ncbi:glycosyltransferase family 39 protein [Gluconobacter sp. OJA]|uniref:ArnT family glycosyltransferase n=1 Tax=Gluconobacter sp. OJA TaxID=3145197 RepID=UPI0031F9A24B
MKLTFRHYALLGLVTFLLALPGRMTLPPLDRDEPRYMEASEQMLTSGNFVDVRFQDKPRYLQPAGIYWLEASSAKIAEKLFGSDVLRKTWPYRIPSLIAAALIIPLTAWMGSALFGAVTGLMAAGLLMVSTLFVAESHMATIDTVLLLDILCFEAMLLKAFLDRQKNSPTSVWVACGYWLALGVGLMLKGPVVLIPGFCTPLALWAVERDREWWSRLRPRWGWLLMLAVVVPWCVAIDVVSHGDFFSRAIGRNFLGKVAHGQEAHGLPPGFHLIVFALAFWPGSFFAALAIPSVWKNRKLPQVRFLLSWIIPHWLVFELIATKLPHYVLPTYPAIAILTAAALTIWGRPALSKWSKIALGFYGVIWAAVGLAFCFAGTVVLYKMQHMLSIRECLALCGALPLMGGAILLLIRNHRQQAAFCAMGAAVIAQAGLFLAVIPNLQTIRLAPRVAALFEDVKPCAQTVLVSTSYSEPSLVFLVGEHTQLIGREAAAAYLQQNPRCTLALVDRKDEKTFRDALNRTNLSIVEYGRIQGLNYSNGHHLDLGMFAPD